MATRGAIIHPKAKAVTSGYALDVITVSRRTGAADSEGNPSDTLAVVAAINRGHVRSLEPKRGSQQEASHGGRGATQAEAILVIAPGLDIRVSDIVAALGRTFVVEAVDKQRLKTRCWLRRAV